MHLAQFYTRHVAHEPSLIAVLAFVIRCFERGLGALHSDSLAVHDSAVQARFDCPVPCCLQDWHTAAGDVLLRIVGPHDVARRRNVFVSKLDPEVLLGIVDNLKS